MPYPLGHRAVAEVDWDILIFIARLTYARKLDCMHTHTSFHSILHLHTLTFAGELRIWVQGHQVQWQLWFLRCSCSCKGCRLCDICWWYQQSHRGRREWPIQHFFARNASRPYYHVSFSDTQATAEFAVSCLATKPLIVLNGHWVDTKD